MTSNSRSPAAGRESRSARATVALILPFVILYGLIALFAFGCQPGLTVIDADAPVRLAEPTRAKVYVDVGPKATPGQPHVEQWVLQPNDVELAAGKYVITRRVPATTATSAGK